MSDKPLWRKGKNEASPYEYADWNRLEKEEAKTILLLRKEEKYTNQDDGHQYWVNYHTKYGWSVARRAIAPKSEEGNHIEDTHPEAKAQNGNEPIPKANGTFEYRQYWENRQKYQEAKDIEIKQMQQENLAATKAHTDEIKSLRITESLLTEEINKLRLVLDMIAQVLSKKGSA